MAKKRIVVHGRRKRGIPPKCYFCGQGLTPNYKEMGVIAPFLSPRGKIVPRIRTGICAKHQRKLASTVKRARIMAMA